MHNAQLYVSLRRGCHWQSVRGICNCCRAACPQAADLSKTNWKSIDFHILNKLIVRRISIERCTTVIAPLHSAIGGLRATRPTEFVFFIRTPDEITFHYALCIMNYALNSPTNYCLQILIFLLFYFISSVIIKMICYKSERSFSNEKDTMV